MYIHLFQDIPLPSANVWSLYPALGVLLVMLIVFAWGIRVAWREYKDFQDGQDKKRAEERDKQRSWEEEQDRKRNERWIGFVAGMEEDQKKEQAQNREKMTDLANVISAMKDAIDRLVGIVNNHILEDNARFEVLLTPDQKKATEDVKTQSLNRKK